MTQFCCLATVLLNQLELEIRCWAVKSDSVAPLPLHLLLIYFLSKPDKLNTNLPAHASCPYLSNSNALWRHTPIKGNFVSANSFPLNQEDSIKTKTATTILR